MESETQFSWQASEPRVLRLWPVLRMNGYGFLLGLPVLVAVAWVSFRPLSWQTYVVPLAVVAAAVICLPVGLGNTYARKLARRFSPHQPEEAFLVQITVAPRLRSGLRALLDDADDIGWLQVTPDGLCFTGDSLRFTMPLNCATSLRFRNIGYRGLFIYGPRLCIRFEGPGGIREIEFADRSSTLLPQSWRPMKQLREKLEPTRG